MSGSFVGTRSAGSLNVDSLGASVSRGGSVRLLSHIAGSELVLLSVTLLVSMFYCNSISLVPLWIKHEKDSAVLIISTAPKEQLGCINTR